MSQVDVRSDRCCFGRDHWTASILGPGTTVFGLKLRVWLLFIIECSPIFMVCLIIED